MGKFETLNDFYDEERNDNDDNKYKYVLNIGGNYDEPILQSFKKIFSCSFIYFLNYYFLQVVVHLKTKYI